MRFFLAFFMIILGAAISVQYPPSSGTIAMGAFLPLLCLFQPISNENCPKGRGGISKAWVTECINVVQIIFNTTDRTIVGLLMNASPSAGRFVQVTFEKKTGSFEQAKTKVKNGTNVTQTLTFIEPTLNPVTSRLLEDLNDCCCYNVIVKDNNGKLHYAGVSYFKDNDTYEDEDMKTGDGSGNTGADPTADASEYNETLVADTVWYAPFYALPESTIPV